MSVDQGLISPTRVLASFKLVCPHPLKIRSCYLMGIDGERYREGGRKQLRMTKICSEKYVGEKSQRILKKTENYYV